MNATKTKILTAALKLFNQDGLVNVRLQHIADEAFVSVGNLAYHYKNKEAILSKLYETLTSKQQQLLTEYRIVPLFENIDRLLQQTFDLQQEYIFFYLDTLEIVRAYPEIGKAHQQHIRSQVGQLRMILDFNVARGALIAEPTADTYKYLAAQIWQTTDFWLTYQHVQSVAALDQESYQRAVWNLLIPYFTNTGRREYEQMLGRPYDFYL